jgi:hypothetical protein
MEQDPEARDPEQAEASDEVVVAVAAEVAMVLTPEDIVYARNAEKELSTS